MASDELIWQVINQQMCSFKLKTSKDQTFCRNEYNVTGLCLRQACPLANSRYATIRSDPANPQALYLYTKTIERAHLPSKLWERQKLSANYAKALEQIDSELAYWPKYLIHKCKQRVTRLTQVALRMKRLAKEEARLGERVVPKLAPKIRRREEGRERKAERAARVERAIERELMDRLRSGAYGDKPLNVEEGMWQKVLAGLERSGEGVRDEDIDEGIEEEEEELDENEEYETELADEDLGDVEYVSDIDGESDEDDFGDVEDWSGPESGESQVGDNSDEPHGPEDEEDEKLRKSLAGIKRKATAKPTRRAPPAKRKGALNKGPTRQIEYEIENEPPLRETVAG